MSESETGLVSAKISIEMDSSSRSLSAPKSSASLKAPTRSEPRDRSAITTLYCLVFPTEHKKKSREEVNEDRQLLLDRIVESGLHVELFYSVQRDEVYCKVGASDTRLLMEADAAQYKLQLEPESIRVLAEQGGDGRAPIFLEPPYSPHEEFNKLDSKTGTWVPMASEEILPFLQRQTSLSPFQDLYARYNDSWEVEAKQNHDVQIYKVQPDGSILRNADRMKLCREILERSTSTHPTLGTRGAGLNLDKLRMTNDLLGAFPLQTAATSHNAHEVTVEELRSMWITRWYKPWNQPLAEIRDYFGEKIALYFAFLGHYTLWLVFPAIIGVAIFGHQLYATNSVGLGFLEPSRLVPILADGEEITNTTEYRAEVVTEVIESPFFGLFMALWASLLMEFWKRKQATYALKWGMVGFENDESARVEFQPTHNLPSPITGLAESYYSERKFLVKVSGSATILFFCICIVFAAIAGVFILKVTVTQLEGVKDYGIDESVAPKLALVVNALVIQSLGFMYKSIAKKLNDWENHRTDTEYEDSLIAKSFIFNFVNSYATLTYIAFVKSGTTVAGVEQFCIAKVGDRETAELVASGASIADACFGGLGYSLLIIFGSQLVVNNTIEVLKPLLLSWWSRRQNLKDAPKSKVQANDDLEAASLPTDEASEQLLKTKSPAEDQFFLETYEGTFDDFLEIALQFGYVTLFVVAFPLAPFLALLNNFVEIRVDSFKLCKLSRRPEMQSAEDIGTWYKIFAVIGQAAVVSNAAVICFSSANLLPDLTEYFQIDYLTLRVWSFILFIVVVWVIKMSIDFFIPDVPKEVTIQIARNEYLVRKCLIGEKDDESLDEAHAHVAERVDHKIAFVDPEIRRLLDEIGVLIAGDMESVEQMFKRADTNSNGEISLAEFTAVLRNIGGVAKKLTEDEIVTLVHALDNNGNGQIDYSEFSAFMEAYK